MDPDRLDQPTHEIVDPAERDAIAAAKLTAMLAHVDADPLDWPADTRDVLRAAQMLGYRVDGDYLIGLLNQGIPPVVKLGGKHRWTAFDAWHLLAVLDSRRRWELHPLHLHKLSALERLVLEAEAAGKPAFDDLDNYSVEQLLLLMELAETTALRHMLRVALMAKLRENGWL